MTSYIDLYTDVTTNSLSKKETLLKNFFLFDKRIDGVVDVLPAPTEGQVYFLSTDLRVYLAFGGAWFSTSIPQWFSLILKQTGEVLVFNGDTLISSEDTGGPRLDSIEQTISQYGTVVTKNVEDFISPEQLQQAIAGINTQQPCSVINYEALMALQGEENQLVSTLGYYIPGDRGHASYVWRDGCWRIQIDGSVNVRQFGAVGDSITDDTVAVQNALDTFIKVDIPPHTYCRVRGKLYGNPCQIIEGASAEISQIMRDTVYGDTLTFLPKNGLNPGAIKISNVWFNHQYKFDTPEYVPGVSSLLNSAMTNKQLVITSGQNIRIKDCWFSGTGYGVYGTDCYNVWIGNCTFDGIWDVNRPALQDCAAGIFFKASSPSDRCDNININECRIGGYSKAGVTNVTTGNVTTSKELNAGMLMGVWLQSAERFTITNNYIGGQSLHSIYLECKAIIAHGQITGNMLDGSGDGSIVIQSYSASLSPSFISIGGNTGVGYGLDKNFLKVTSPAGIVSCTQLSVFDNTGQFYLQSALNISNVVGFKLKDNTFSAYNSDGCTSGDASYESGCYLNSGCKMVKSSGNSWGGAINNPAGPNKCRWGIFFDTVDASNSCSNESDLGMGSTMPTSLIAGSIGGVLAKQTYPL